MIDTDAIPRYRDDEKVAPEEVAVSPLDDTGGDEKVASEVVTVSPLDNTKFEEEIPSAAAVSPLEETRDDENVAPKQIMNTTALPTAMVQHTEDPHQDTSAFVAERPERWRRRKSSLLRLKISIPDSALQSQRSSWGLGRDTWDLMPSVVFWDRGGLGKAMNLR